MDEAGVIQSSVKQRLERVLREVNERNVAQIQVLTVRSLNEEPIESFSGRVVDEWQLGDKQKDNGVLVLVSVGDRRSRIEVGRGLEGAIPDIIAKRIQSEFMRPQFKNGDYGAGIEAGVAEIISLADAEFGGNTLEKPLKINWSTWIPLLELGFVFLLFIFGTIAGRGRRRRRGFFYDAMGAGWGSSSGWGGGGGSWGGSSGGSWGGGGGGFGGGGASDSW